MNLFKEEPRFVATSSLRDERKARKLSMRQVALVAGISKSMYSYIENGKHSTSREVAEAIKGFFDFVPKKVRLYADVRR